MALPAENLVENHADFKILDAKEINVPQINPGNIVSTISMGLNLVQTSVDLIDKYKAKLETSCTFLFHNFSKHTVMLPRDYTSYYTLLYKDAVLLPGVSGHAVLHGDSVDTGHWDFAIQIPGASDWFWPGVKYFNEEGDKNGWYLKVPDKDGDTVTYQGLGQELFVMEKEFNNKVKLNVAVFGYRYPPSVMNVYIYDAPLP